MLRVDIDVEKAIIEYLAGCTIEINIYDGKPGDIHNPAELVMKDEYGRTLTKVVYINDYRGLDNG